MGIKDGKLKGSHLSVYTGDEWEPLGLKKNSGARPSILDVARDSKNILLWGINVLLAVMGLKAGRLKGSHCPFSKEMSGSFWA
jgi:hypothetical protein